jgi:hypothetical protein
MKTNQTSQFSKIDNIISSFLFNLREKRAKEQKIEKNSKK